jgi:hypothetical protein
MPTKKLLVTIILLTSGLVFSSIAGWLYYQQMTLERNGLTAQGTVVDLLESSDSDGTSYAPVIQFTTQGGRQVEFRSNHYSFPSEYEIGQTVTVSYLPENPANATIQNQGRLLIILLAIMGLLDLSLGTFFGIKTFSAIFQGE